MRAWSTEYQANEIRLRYAHQCVASLTSALGAAPNGQVREAVAVALAAAEGARAGYNFRDDELYIEERGRTTT